MTHKLAYNISLFLCRNKSIDEENMDIYTYGFEVLIDSLIETVLLLVTGGILGCVFETGVFIIAFGIIRSFTGGYHAKSKIVCTITTVLTCMFNLIFSCYVEEFTQAYVMLGLIGTLIIWMCAPKAHTNKSLDEDIRAKNRTKSRMLCVIYMIGILVLQTVSIRIVNVLALTLLQVSVLLLGKEGNESEEVT